MLFLDKVWPTIQKAPIWVWGALASVVGFVVLGRRARVAEQYAAQADQRATEATLERDTAVAEAQVEVHTERADELAYEQDTIREQTVQRVDAAADMSDKEVAQWLLRDSQRRAEGVEGGSCTLPPAGWFCTRQRGHEGPCAAHPTKDKP